MLEWAGLFDWVVVGRVSGLDVWRLWLSAVTLTVLSAKGIELKLGMPAFFGGEQIDPHSIAQ